MVKTVKHKLMELKVRVALLNRLTQLDRPMTVPVASIPRRLVSLWVCAPKPT